MGGQKHQPWSRGVWELAELQHGVASRAQLLGLGLSPRMIEHRIQRGRLHPLWRGVYAIGRPGVSREGRWMGAVLACGPHALLSHRSAAELWGLLDRSGPPVEVVVPVTSCRRHPEIHAYRRSALPSPDRRLRQGIPVTGAVDTLIDIAALRDPRLESALEAADRLDRIDPEALQAELEARRPRPGSGRLLQLLRSQTFSPTDSVLERRFLAIVAAAGLPPPSTQEWVNGFRVDFYWPRFGLVAETDGLRYHRTPGRQAKDLRRDQIHIASGLRTLRFPAAQLRDDPATVARILTQTMADTRD